ncbi:MAG TPA: hypothetical protein VEP67_13340 [Thiobacillaceae bacterium]|nr:hypothetical protein [Thiobacillaceae bacterium]
MPESFEMLKFIARRRSASGRKGLNGSKSTTRNRPADRKPSDYEAHHALVDGLERFNGAMEAPSLERIKALRVLEQEGLPLQHKVIEQYLRNQEILKLARQVLWRECHLFWAQLALAHVNLLKQAVKRPARDTLKSWLAVLAMKSIRYTALSFRWGYHQGQMPTVFSWRRLNKIYRLAERAQVAEVEIEENGQKTSCAREYSLALLMDLAHPAGLKPADIELAAQILESLPALPLPGMRPSAQGPSHAVDLTTGQGAFKLDDGWVPGNRLRYLDVGRLCDQIEQAQDALPTDQARYFSRQLAGIIERGGVRRGSPRTESGRRYWVAVGMEAILAILDSQRSAGTKPTLEPWLSKDVSKEGMGFVAEEGTPLALGELLLVSEEPAANNWQLLVVRWNRSEDGKMLVGAQCLSRHPIGVCCASPEQPDQVPTRMVFMPLLDTREGLSNLLLPRSVFDEGLELKLYGGNLAYRLLLGAAVEEHGDWIRSGLEVLAREPVEKVA